MTGFTLSGAFCLYNKVCILEQSEDSTLIGMVHAEDSDLMDRISAAFIESTSGSGTISFMPVTEETCLRRITGSMAGAAEVQEPGVRYGGSAKARSGGDDSLFRSGSTSPAVSLLDNIMLEALDRHASDIHLEPCTDATGSETQLSVRFRIAGQLVPFKLYDPSVFPQLIMRLKVLSGLKTAESRHCQDGRFLWSVADGDDDSLQVDVRVSCIPVWNGESVVLRLLKTMEEPPTLTELGFSQGQQQTLGRLLSAQNRLILVCGPTGAGKTTTLAALLSVLAAADRKIVTIEDPVEYRIRGVTQVEVHEENGMGFEEVLRRMFRHDPDVLMIGEIRDELTARTAVRAALTGHLVFATLHTSDACTAAVRLLDLGIPPYLLSSVFGAAVAQKLIPSARSGTSRFAGRTVAAEILEGTPDVLELLSRNCTQRELADCMTASGMPRLSEDAAVKEIISHD